MRQEATASRSDGTRLVHDFSSESEQGGRRDGAHTGCRVRPVRRSGADDSAVACRPTVATRRPEVARGRVRLRRRLARRRRARPSRMPAPARAGDRALNDTWPIRSMSDSELRDELLVAAMAPGDRRIDRYRLLLAEWRRRAADRAETATGSQRFPRG